MAIVSISQQPKVLVACCTYDKQAYCLDEFLESVKKIDYNFDFFMVDNSQKEDYSKKIKSKGIEIVWDNKGGKVREKISRGREIIRKKAIDGNYDYLFLLDQDVITPPFTIKKLLAAKKNIISGLYYSKIEKDGIVRTIPIIYVDTKVPGKVTYLSLEESFKNKIRRIRACGGGCLLLSKKAFTKLDFIIPENLDCGGDVYYCINAYNKKFDIYVDTEVRCKHLITQLDDKWKYEDYK